MKALKFIKKPWVLITLVVVLAGSGYLIYRSVKSNKTTTTYKTATASKGTLTATVAGTGNLIVETSSNVNPSISGEVKDLAVKVGDVVTAGQTLFKIVNDDLDLSVSKAYASVLQAQQTVTDSQNELTSLQNQQTTLASDEKATDDQKTEVAQKIVKAETSLAVSKINLSSAQSSYNDAKKTATKRTVTATIGGTVTAVNISNGDTIGNSSSSSSSAGGSGTTSTTSTSSSASIVINDLSSIKASISLNEVDASSVEVGQAVSMTFDAIDDLTLTGKIVAISTEGTESSGVVSYPATVSFDSLDSRLKPQMSVSATITTKVKQDVVYIPNAAVKSSDSESYVLIMKDGSPVKQIVEVGIANDSYTEITSGLSEGDTIVTQTITSSSKTSTTSSSKSTTSTSSLQGLTGGGSGTPPTGGGGPGM